MNKKTFKEILGYTTFIFVTLMIIFTFYGLIPISLLVLPIVLGFKISGYFLLTYPIMIIFIILSGFIGVTLSNEWEKFMNDKGYYL